MIPSVFLPTTLATAFAHIEIEEVEPGHWHGMGMLPGLSDPVETFKSCLRLAEGRAEKVSARGATAVLRAIDIEERYLGVRIETIAPTATAPIPSDLLLLLCGADWIRIVRTAAPWGGAGPMHVHPWLRTGGFGTVANLAEIAMGHVVVAIPSLVEAARRAQVWRPGVEESSFQTILVQSSMGEA